MKIYIGLIFAFLVLVYVYTFIKLHKKRKNKVNEVALFNEKYLKDKADKSKESNYNASNYQNQITKYNSRIDYVDKDQLC